MNGGELGQLEMDHSLVLQLKHTRTWTQEQQHLATLPCWSLPYAGGRPMQALDAAAAAAASPTATAAAPTAAAGSTAWQPLQRLGGLPAGLQGRPVGVLQAWWLRARTAGTWVHPAATAGAAQEAHGSW